MLKPIVAFRLLTIAAFLAVLISSTLVMRALLGYPGWFCVASLLLCQELFVSSYYPNSNMLALACGVMALAVLATGKSWLRACSAGVLYGIGVWMRFDLVLICLVFPVVMNPRSRRDWAQVLSMAVLSVVVSNLLLWASGASLARVLSSYGTHDNAFKDFGQTLRMYGVVFTGLTLVTTSCGLLYYWNTRSWRLLLLCAAAALPSVFAFGISVTTPKYLLYAVTIVTVASATGLWRLIQEGGRTARAGVAVLFAAQYIFNPFWLAPGEGKVATDDGVRRVGAVYANIVDWHQSSRASGDSAQRLNDHLQSYLARELNAVIVVRENSHRSLVPYYLLLGRYTFDRALPCSQGHVLFFSRNNRTAALFVLDAARNDPLTIDELTELDIPIPKRLQLIGYLKPEMISFAKSSRQRGTGKYGTCLVECR